MKKILCAFLPCLLTVFLFGCSDKPNDQASSMTSDTSNTSSAADTAEVSSIISSGMTAASSTSSETASVVSKVPTSSKPTSTAKPESSKEENSSETEPDYILLMNSGKFTGREYEHEKTNLESLGFKVDVIFEYSDTVKKDTIIKCSIPDYATIYYYTKEEMKATLWVSKGKYIEFPNVPYTILEQQSGIKLMTITNFEYESTTITVTFRNDSEYKGNCWIFFKVYDKDGVVVRSPYVIGSSLEPGESAKETFRIPDDGYKVVVNDSESKILA